MRYPEEYYNLTGGRIRSDKRSWLRKATIQVGSWTAYTWRKMLMTGVSGLQKLDQHGCGVSFASQYLEQSSLFGLLVSLSMLIYARATSLPQDSLNSALIALVPFLSR